MNICPIHGTGAPVKAVDFCTCDLGQPIPPDQEWQLANGADGKPYGEVYVAYYRGTILDAIDAEIARLPDPGDMQEPEDVAFRLGRGYALQLLRRRFTGPTTGTR